MPYCYSIVFCHTIFLNILAPLYHFTRRKLLKKVESLCFYIILAVFILSLFIVTAALLYFHSIKLAHHLTKLLCFIRTPYFVSALG